MLNLIKVHLDFHTLLAKMVDNYLCVKFRYAEILLNRRIKRMPLLMIG
jgi:hypothetical protein